MPSPQLGFAWRGHPGDGTALLKLGRDLGWPALTDAFDVIDINAGHSSLLREAFVQSLATALGPLLAGSASVEARVAPLANA